MEVVVVVAHQMTQVVKNVKKRETEKQNEERQKKQTQQ